MHPDQAFQVAQHRHLDDQQTATRWRLSRLAKRSVAPTEPAVSREPLPDREPTRRAHRLA
ncbi:hypothetical protein [Actinokineospora sp. NBRC 105648]|uniref:hypothetical protein n=1 Tax=Actinokineospora sp. NBRC 105648 TaxID=3032206 RepID=UPI0024A60284|nr:hypothetical protein [Actinokineospora sp. NBRC 105648]GLZ37725.1 hypothetical protein Acsp05_13500 [Actinokineospora sp. NBRC 105648]